MVDESGYLKLIDMGTAKILTDDIKNLSIIRTFTILGTPHYVYFHILIQLKDGTRNIIRERLFYLCGYLSTGDSVF